MLPRKLIFKYSAPGCELLQTNVILQFYLQLYRFIPAKCLIICFSTIDSNFSLEVNVNISPGNKSNSYSDNNAACKSSCQSPSMHGSFRSCKCSWVLNWGFFWPSNKGLHAQSSFSGSLRKAGALFRNDTVRVTSSPALRRTCTWKRNIGRHFEINLWPKCISKCKQHHTSFHTRI